MQDLIDRMTAIYGKGHIMVAGFKALCDRNPHDRKALELLVEVHEKYPLPDKNSY